MITYTQTHFVLPKGAEKAAKVIQTAYRSYRQTKQKTDDPYARNHPTEIVVYNRAEQQINNEISATATNPIPRDYLNPVRKGDSEDVILAKTTKIDERLSSEVLSEVLRLSQSDDFNVRLALSRNRGLHLINDENVVENLLNRNDKFIFQSLIMRPIGAKDPRIAERLLHHEDIKMQGVLASSFLLHKMNTDIPVHLSTINNADVITNLARNSTLYKMPQKVEDNIIRSGYESAIEALNNNQKIIERRQQRLEDAQKASQIRSRI